MKDRLWIPDYLKGWAVIIMIQAHVFQTWIRQDLLLTDVGEVIRVFNTIPAAPMFMLIMGFLAFYTRTGTQKLMLRGLKVMFWGLLLNIGLNFHYLLRIFTGAAEGNPLEAIFGIDIFFLAGFALIVIGLIRKLKKPELWAFLLALLIAAIAPFIHDRLTAADSQNYILAFFGTRAPWSFFPVFPWLAYPLAGYSFGAIMKITSSGSTVRKQLVWTLLIIIPVGLTGFVKNWNDLADLQAFYKHGFEVFLWSVAFTGSLVILLSLFPSLKNTGFSAWLRLNGRFLTRVYVIQWLITGNMASFFYQELGFGAYLAGSLMVSAITTWAVYSFRDVQFSFTDWRKL